jgi:hypothetical protein
MARIYITEVYSGVLLEGEPAWSPREEREMLGRADQIAFQGRFGSTLGAEGRLTAVLWGSCDDGQSWLPVTQLWTELLLSPQVELTVQATTAGLVLPGHLRLELRLEGAPSAEARVWATGRTA